MIDRVSASVSVPASLKSREAQAEVLANATMALGQMMAASGLHGLRITFEIIDDDVQLIIIPSDFPGDAEILQAIGAKVKSGGILKPDVTMPMPKVQH